MIRLKDLIQPYLENAVIDNDTLLFCENKISKAEYISRLDSCVLNEDITSIFNSIKSKIVDGFYTLLVQAYKIGMEIFSKFTSLFKWVIDKIKSFEQKHPILFKIIVIAIIVFIILVVCAASAKAATEGQPVNVNKINMAIGWLESLRGNGKYDDMLLNKAIAHLVDLKDGHMEITTLGDKAIKTADIALDLTDKMVSTVKGTKDDTLAKYCIDLIAKGQSYIQAIYTKGDGFERVKLLVK